MYICALFSSEVFKCHLSNCWFSDCLSQGHQFIPTDGQGNQEPDITIHGRTLLITNDLTSEGKCLKRGRKNTSWENILHTAGDKSTHDQPTHAGLAQLCPELETWFWKHTVWDFVIVIRMTSLWDSHTLSLKTKKPLSTKGKRKSLFTYVPFFLTSDIL